jgi:hypothetical protein
LKSNDDLCLAEHSDEAPIHMIELDDLIGWRKGGGEIWLVVMNSTYQTRRGLQLAIGKTACPVKHF